jgi:hypothetical protein
MRLEVMAALLCLFRVAGAMPNTLYINLGLVFRVFALTLTDEADGAMAKWDELSKDEHDAVPLFAHTLEQATWAICRIAIKKARHCAGWVGLCSCSATTSPFFGCSGKRCKVICGGTSAAVGSSHSQWHPGGSSDSIISDTSSKGAHDKSQPAQEAG